MMVTKLPLDSHGHLSAPRLSTCQTLHGKMLSSSILTTHLTDEETEGPRGEGTCLWPQQALSFVPRSNRF